MNSSDLQDQIIALQYSLLEDFQEINRLQHLAIAKKTKLKDLEELREIEKRKDNE